ncbi:MAG TPA: hypothetical protein EYG21_07165 [Nitrospinaceae bacterium]|nr:hypothetical protein [Nitrospinaceae bacterium]
MPSKLTTGQIDSGTFVQFIHQKLSGHGSGYYLDSNPLSFVPLSSFTGYSGDISSRSESQDALVSGALDTSGTFLFSKISDVSGHAESFATGASGALFSDITSLSGLFTTTTGELLNSGSFYHTGSGDFSVSAPTGAIAFSRGHNKLYVATGDSTNKSSWMHLAGHPEMTGYVSTTSGDLKSSLNTSGTNLSTRIDNILSDSSVNFTSQKTFSSGIKTNKIALSGNGVTLRVNANNSVTFDDTSGALLTLAPGYGADAPVFSVTDKAGLPLVDIYDDDTLNFGPYGKNPFNISGERVYFGNYKSYISGSTVSFSGDPLTVNDVLTISGLSGGYVFLNNLPEWPNIGGLNSGALFRSGNPGVGPSTLCVV